MRNATTPTIFTVCNTFVTSERMPGKITSQVDKDIEIRKLKNLQVSLLRAQEVHKRRHGELCVCREHMRTVHKQCRHRTRGHPMPRSKIRATKLVLNRPVQHWQCEFNDANVGQGIVVQAEKRLESCRRIRVKTAERVPAAHECDVRRLPMFHQIPGMRIAHRAKHPSGEHTALPFLVQMCHGVLDREHMLLLTNKCPCIDDAGGYTKTRVFSRKR